MWTKSSYSDAGYCLEWRKSSLSSAAGNCVEFADADGVLLRDSKNTEGPVLSFTSPAWGSFLGAIRSGVFA